MIWPHVDHYIWPLCFANIRSARNRLTGSGMQGKNRRHGGPFPVRVSIRPVAPQRPSGRGHRERSATNANSGLSAEAEAPVADDLGPDVLDWPPESVARLAQALALRPGRHGGALAARTIPEILGQAVSAAAPASRSSPHRHRTPPIDLTNGHGQSLVARTQDSRRTQDARYRPLGAHCLAHPAHAPPPAEPALEDLPAQPCRPNGIH